MTRSNPFALPPLATKTTKVLLAASEYVHERLTEGSDARTIIKGLVLHYGASLSYPTYRTAFRCGDIYTEAAASCGLVAAELLLSSFMDKAQRYLAAAGCDA